MKRSLENFNCREAREKAAKEKAEREAREKAQKKKAEQEAREREILDYQNNFSKYETNIPELVKVLTYGQSL